MTTKKLAKELGLLRQRSQSSRSKKSLVSNQIFSYLIVIDFESTCWRDKNNHSQEIIEFPAVLLNTSTGDVESEFHTYVQPQEHPVLSEFCTELTGITQMQVEAGIPLQICLSQFSRWLQNLQLEKEVVFPNTQPRQSEPSPQQKLCTFLTWSDWDLGVCLQYECKRKQLHKPDVLNSWIDLRSTYRLFYSRKPKGLNGALQDLGIQFSGREHSGLDDSRNTAKLAARMMRDGCIMKITKSLDRNLLVGKSKFGKSPCLFDKENRTNTKEDASTTSKSSSSKAPRRASQMQPCSESDTKDLDTKKNSGSAQPSLPACQSLISPKTLLNGSAGPLWGRSRRSAASDGGANTSYSVTTNSTSTGAHSNNSKSLVLCSTTVSFFSNPPQRNQSAETGLTSGLMEVGGAQLLVETEERCGSYDDVVLDEGDSRNGSEVRCGTEFTSDFDRGCYECVEANDLHSPVHQYKSKEDLREAWSARRNSKMQNITGDSSAKTRAYAKTSDHLNEVMQHAGTSATYFTVARRKTELKTPVTLKETSVRPRVSFKTSIPSLITPKPFVPEKTSTPNTSFARPEPVLKHLKHHKTLKSSFTVFTEPTKPAAAPPRSSSRGSLRTPNNILSSLLTNTRSSFSTHSSLGTTAKGVQRVTSPLCECGRRAKRQLVSNGGPNHGRGFYCCPVRRSGGGRVEKGCQFFKWESAVMKSSSVRAPPIRSSVSLCQMNSTLSLQQAHRPTRKSC